MADEDLVKRIYQAFDPSPLRQEERELYVDLDPVRGAASVVERLARPIALARRPTCQVLTGHRGSGKSTELHRLQHRLENPSSGQPRFFTVFCTLDEDVDRNDLDFPDLLTAVMRNLGREIHQRLNVQLEPGYFRKRWQDLKSLLGSEVSFDGLDLEVGCMKIATSIKASPKARAAVREMLEPDTSNLLNAANEVIGQAIKAVIAQGYNDLAIIVDDLDKMVVRPHPSAGKNTAEYFFVDREAQLRAFQCHVVYSMPIALAYSCQEATIAQLYGGNPRVVPMVKVVTPPPTCERYQPGYDAMQMIIRTRLEHIRVSHDQVFCETSVMDKLIALSGGQPRELMILIGQALLTGLPITLHSVELAARDGRRAYARQIRSEHLPILRQVATTGRLERCAGTEELIRELLDNRAILQYVNDEEWYGLNPLLPPVGAESTGSRT